MTTRETGWQEAIITVLQDTDGPLKYDAITQIIGERGLRALTGATPANSLLPATENLISEQTAQSANTL